MSLTGLRPGATPRQVRRTARILILVAVCLIAADISALIHHESGIGFALVGLTSSVVIIAAALVMLRRNPLGTGPGDD